MSAVPEHFMHEPPKSWEQSFWHWFAIGVLAFCWIAEASMCAERGF